MPDAVGEVFGMRWGGMKLVFSVLLCVLLCGCILDPQHDVRYEVKGGAGVSKTLITYENASGGTSQTTTSSLPWTYSFKAKSGRWVYVSVQNGHSDGGVQANIYVDGDLWKTSTSNGGYVIATASGTI